jgi:hypothetical protein
MISVLGSRNSQEPGELYKTPFLMVGTKRKSLEWLGHVLRMDESRLAKRILKVSQKEEEEWEGPDVGGRMI